MNKNLILFLAVVIALNGSLIYLDVLSYNGFEGSEITDEEIDTARAELETTRSWDFYGSEDSGYGKIMKFTSETAEAEVIIDSNSEVIAKEVEYSNSSLAEEGLDEAEALERARTVLETDSSEAEQQSTSYGFRFNNNGKIVDVTYENGFLSKEVQYETEDDEEPNLDE